MGNKKVKEKFSFYDNDFNNFDGDLYNLDLSLGTFRYSNQSLLTYFVMTDRQQPPNKQYIRIPLNRGQVEQKTNDPKAGILPSLNTGFRPTQRVDLPKPPKP